MLRNLALQARRIAASGCGSERLRIPGDVVARAKPRFSQFGITRLCETTHLDRIGWPVWAAIRPNAPTLSVCQGKGPTDDAAQASAVMEAIEIAVAEEVVPSRVTSRAAIEAEGGRVDLLADLVREGQALPPDDEAIGWLEGHDLMAGHDVWVPAGAVKIDATDPHRRYWQSSDGLGSGSLMVEAVLHGLYEQIERDAGEFWFLRSDAEIESACVDPHALGSDEVSTMARAVAAADLHLRVFDAGSDIGVPVYFATVSPRPDNREAGWTHFDLASGMGCRLDPGRAAAAAIGEALQSRLTTISGARDDYEPQVYQQPIASDVLVYPRAWPRSAIAVPVRTGVPIGEALETVLDRLRRAAIGRVIVVRLHEDDDIAVAKVLTPGLEHPPGARAMACGPRMQRATGDEP